MGWTATDSDPSTCPSNSLVTDEGFSSELGSKAVPGAMGTGFGILAGSRGPMGRVEGKGMGRESKRR